MNDSAPSLSPPLPSELRVHGVGGPQVTKMLGDFDDTEVVTVPPFPTVDRGVPVDTETRFAQRLRDGTEAYEWGGLTEASLTKALWVLYLPFTLVNAGGWAHGPCPSTNGGPDVTEAVRWHLRLTYVAAGLATLTYVAWITYICLDLVARAWVEHVKGSGSAAPEGFVRDLVVVGAPRIAVVVCVALIVGLFRTPVRKGRFEQVPEVAGADDPGGWALIDAICDPGFFAHERSHGRRLTFHFWLAIGALAFAVGQYMASWHRLGVVLLGLAAAQSAVLAALIFVDTRSREQWLPSETVPQLQKDQVVDDFGARFPSGAAFVVLGTAMAHAAFSGLAMFLSPLLARWPAEDAGDQLPIGAELGAADILAWTLVLLVVAVVVVVVVPIPRRQAASGAGPFRVVVALARRVPMLATGALSAVVVPAAVWLWLNGRAIVDDGLSTWYDTYEVADSVFRTVGGAVLVALPAVVFGAMLRPHETGFGRVVGNVWDVLTFWPRRFHPYAVPCSAERSVPELRARIRYIRSEAGGHPLVVVAHSQGSILSGAAIGSLPSDCPAPGLVTFGSPLGTLFTPTWPAYVPPLLVQVAARVEAGSAKRWVNFWRETDPVGGQVPVACNPPALVDPPRSAVSDLGQVAALPPLERSVRWGKEARHSHYLAEPRVQAAIGVRKLPGTSCLRSGSGS